MPKTLTLTVLSLASLAFITSAALAQTYPTKPVRVIVPLPAGSVTDLAIRAIGAEMTATLGQPWVVDNRPGGAMVIGAELCAKAPADGYTLCVVSPDAMSFNPYLLPNLPYDPDKDFTPVADLFNVIEGVIRSASLSANSMAELKAAAASRSLNVATLGPGSTPDVFRRWLNDQWKTQNLVEVSYKGGADVANALFKAEVDLGRIGIGNVAGQLGDGKIKVLAVSSLQRSPLLPEVPTLAESGLGAYPVNVWWGLMGPAKLPDAVVSKLNSALATVFSGAKTKDFLDKQFLVSRLGTPAAFATFLKTDRANVAELLTRYNIPRQ